MGFANGIRDCVIIKTLCGFINLHVTMLTLEISAADPILSTGGNHLNCTSVRNVRHENIIINIILQT